MHHHRFAKIIATLGPSSNNLSMIKALFEAGVDVFRLNLSHGSHSEHEQLYYHVRSLEKTYNHPVTIVGDLQGPKFRLGNFKNATIQLAIGDEFILDTNPMAGDAHRCCLPHLEVFEAAVVGTELLVDDGRTRLRVIEKKPEELRTIVLTGGMISDHKGVNIPGIRLPISSLTPKDVVDLNFCLNLGIDWIALSFVQHPSDVTQAQQLINNRAKILVKLEKPMAMEFLEEIVALSDGIIVARGDLGVEMRLEEVPVLQKKIIHACRYHAKPVIVATQMLESMIHCSTPTRAEVSDVANAIYEGVDGVMLSAESASGAYPVEAVAMMDRIICQVEKDPNYRQQMAAYRTCAFDAVSNAITVAAREIAHTIKVSAIVTFTQSGITALGAAAQRPESTIVSLTPCVKTARLLNLVWGIYPILCETIYSFEAMVLLACEQVITHHISKPQDLIIITGGIPLPQIGSTNMLRVCRVEEFNNIKH